MEVISGRGSVFILRADLCIRPSMIRQELRFFFLRLKLFVLFSVTFNCALFYVTHDIFRWLTRVDHSQEFCVCWSDPGRRQCLTSSSMFIVFSRSRDENRSIPTQPGKELRGLNFYIVSESRSRRPFYSKFPVIAFTASNKYVATYHYKTLEYIWSVMPANESNRGRYHSLPPK